MKNATLVLAPGRADQYTVNGIAPQPSSENSDNGKLSVSLGKILPGQSYTEFVSLQINPINVGDHARPSGSMTVPGRWWSSITTS